MAGDTSSTPVPDEFLAAKIYVLRKQRIMLDFDLAQLYGVETRALKQQVRRNQDRFPSDFMFVLAPEEFVNLKSQIVISSWGGRRTPPMAFTEHGVLMLSSVLRSKRAIAVNIQIVRVYARLRKMLTAHEDILARLNEMEQKISSNDRKLQAVFETLKKLITEKSAADQQPPRQIGYRRKDDQE